MTIVLGVFVSIVLLMVGVFLGKLTLVAERSFGMDGGWVVFNRIFTCVFYLVGFGGFVFGILFACGLFGHI
jgi:hypothetical protein